MEHTHDIYNTFKCDVAASVYGVPECDTANVRIEYGVEPEYRSWGIKGHYIHIEKITVSLELDTKDFEIINDAKFDEDGCYCFRDCEIDCKRKTITLS